MDGHVFVVLILFSVHTVTTDSSHTVSSRRSGVILSPNYPLKYDNNLNRTWTIRPDDGGHIVLSFHDFYIQCKDHFMIYDGTDNRTLFNTTCHKSLNHSTVILTSDSILVAFETDEKSRRGGFNITWDTCGGTFIGHEGFVTSPKIHYKFFSKGEYDCVFNLKIREIGSAVQVDVSATDLELDTGQCLIQISEIDNRTTIIICTANDPRMYVSNTNQVKLTYKLVEDSGVMLNARYSKYDCSRVVRNASEVLQSPDYPDHFNRDSVCDCVMNFPLSHDQIVELRLTDIGISCTGTDVLEILQYDPDDNLTVVRLCKDNETNVLYTRENTLIRFISKYDALSSRFSINYNVIDIQATSGLSDSSTTSVPFSTTATDIVFTPQSDSLGTIIGAVTTSVAVMAILAMIAVIIYCRKRGNQNNKTDTPSDEVYVNYAVAGDYVNTEHQYTSLSMSTSASVRANKT